MPAYTALFQMSGEAGCFYPGHTLCSCRENAVLLWYSQLCQYDTRNKVQINPELLADEAEV